MKNIPQYDPVWAEGNLTKYPTEIYIDEVCYLPNDKQMDLDRLSELVRLKSEIQELREEVLQLRYELFKKV